jgi:hypothetical protein
MRFWPILLYNLETFSYRLFYVLAVKLIADVIGYIFLAFAFVNSFGHFYRGVLSLPARVRTETQAQRLRTAISQIFPSYDPAEMFSYFFTWPMTPGVQAPFRMVYTYTGSRYYILNNGYEMLIFRV